MSENHGVGGSIPLLGTTQSIPAEKLERFCGWPLAWPHDLGPQGPEGSSPRFLRYFPDAGRHGLPYYSIMSTTNLLLRQEVPRGLAGRRSLLLGAARLYAYPKNHPDWDALERAPLARASQ